MSTHPHDAVLARVTSRWLAVAGGTLGWAGLLLTAAPLAALALAQPQRPWPLWMAALAGAAVLERTIRARFDAALFAGLAAEPDLARLDAALARLFPAHLPGVARTLEERVAGAKRIIVSQGACVAAQAALVLYALLP